MVEVWPSPKTQAKVGVPVQPEGVAVDAKETAVPAVPEAGTVAVHESVHPPPVEMVMVPFLVQVTP